MTNPDWRCEKREIPSEKSKITCEDLRLRTNLYNRMCATQYENAAQCEGSFFSHDNVYRPCVWKAATRSCVDGMQILACDCALMHKGCPVRSGGPSITGAAPSTVLGGVEELDSLSSGEVVIVSIAILVIAAGGLGLIW